jgi:hypothetical protein
MLHSDQSPKLAPMLWGKDLTYLCRSESSSLPFVWVIGIRICIDNHARIGSGSSRSLVDDHLPASLLRFMMRVKLRAYLALPGTVFYPGEMPLVSVKQSE